VIRGVFVALLLIALACDSLPGKPTDADRFVAPEAILDFDTLYAQNCSGCHGAEGRFGSARPLNDPLYLAIAPDSAIQTAIGAGIDGTPMPAFAIDEGGMLTDAQVTALLHGLRANWGTSTGSRGLPAYHATQAGNAARGATAFGVFCAECHGADGRGGEHGGSVVDSSFLALVSDQGLRSAVIAGREDLGMPGYAGYVEGRAMSEREIADVVAWLIAQRARYPGQPHAATAPPAAREGTH